jgi:hypothetical protein
MGENKYPRYLGGSTFQKGERGGSMGKVFSIVEANPKLSDFELFWECYPKKKAKLDAQKAWRQTESLRPEIEKILAALDLQSQSEEWTNQGGMFIPYPASWLRDGRWDDE